MRKLLPSDRFDFSSDGKLLSDSRTVVLNLQTALLDVKIPSTFCKHVRESVFLV